MKYEEQKAKEILKALVDCDLIQGGYTDRDTKIVELKIKEVIRDTRHKCAENILISDNLGNISKGAAHNIVMNTEM